MSIKNGLEYDEIKKLMLVIAKKECSKYDIEYNKLIEDQNNKDTNMLKLKKDELRSLNPSKKELRVIARKRGVKNYKNLTKERLIEEINKLKPAEGPKKIAFKKYIGIDLELRRKDIRKCFRVEKESKDIIGKEKKAC